jgi:hypothetical protein
MLISHITSVIYNAGTEAVPRNPRYSRVHRIRPLSVVPNSSFSSSSYFFKLIILWLWDICPFIFRASKCRMNEEIILFYWTKSYRKPDKKLYDNFETFSLMHEFIVYKQEYLK